MQRVRYELHWIAPAVAKAFAERGIFTRSDVSRAMGWPMSTVYRVFNGEWAGVAPEGMLAQVSGTLKIPICEIAEPVAAGVEEVIRRPRRTCARPELQSSGEAHDH